MTPRSKDFFKSIQHCMFEIITLVFSVVIDENARRIRNCHFKMRNAKYCHYSIDSPISFQYNSGSAKIEETLEF